MVSIEFVLFVCFIAFFFFVCVLIGSSTNYNNVLIVGLVFSGVVLVLVGLFVYFYDKVQGGCYLYLRLNDNLRVICIDDLSLLLLFLTSLIFPLCFLYNLLYVKFAFKYYTFLLIVLEFLIFFCFIVDNLLIFYFLFEALLFPMFLLIGLWGSRGRKIHAAFQFFFFTIASSILLLIGISLIYYKGGSLYFDDFKYMWLDERTQLVVGILFFFGFAAKIPVFPLHIWLPEAHVEAPTVGSVILAALLLKFGFYGMVRIIFLVCDSNVLLILRPIFLTFCCISLVYSAACAVRQIDLKKIIAYSSVVHMNVALLGFFVSFQGGLVGATYLMISHGLISGAMFFCVGLLYERFHIRNFMYFGGLVQYMPLFSVFFFIIMFSNMSLPGTCNFIGEILVFISLFCNGFFVMLLGLMSVVLVAVFCLAVLSRIIFYQITGLLYSNLIDLTFVECLLLFVLIFYIVLFGLMPNLLLGLLDVGFVFRI